MRLRSILVPTDFSASAHAAFKYAQALAVPFKARIHLLHVISAPYLYDAWGTESIAMQMVDLQRQLTRDAKKELDALIPKTGPLARRVTASTAEGTTVEGILEYIAARKIDLVVLGTHGRGLVGHVLLGSVAERVVRHAPVPVLTVHGEPGTPRTRTPARTSKPRR